jgi:ParB family chromosome partitioning protein
MHLEHIRCAEIQPDPRSREYSPDEIEALADDMRENGVLRPVLLRATSEGYVIVHGERRWRAARLAGIEALPAIMVQELASEGALAA